MNVLFFSRLFHPHIGGVEKHVMEISRILIKKGYKVTVITEQHAPDLRVKESVEGIDIFRVPEIKEGKFKKIIIWRWLWKNRDLIRKADVVHCHDVFFWYLPFRFLFATKKIFTTFHGYEDYPLSLKFVLMHKISEKLSMGNICIGDFFKKWYGTKPNFVSYGGVNIDGKRSIQQDQEWQAKNKKHNDKSAIFIGRLDEQTGIETYVNAVKLIVKKIPDFEFEIIGDGELRKKIEKKFKAVGFKKNPEKYFANYNFAFVSRYLSILEAMSAKRLVFAVYDNLLKEDYLRMAPFSDSIIISETPREIVSKMNFYLKSLKEKDELICKAYDWVKNQSWEKLTKTYLNLWGGAAK